MARTPGGRRVAATGVLFLSMLAVAAPPGGAERPRERPGRADPHAPGEIAEPPDATPRGVPRAAQPPSCGGVLALASGEAATLALAAAAALDEPAMTVAVVDRLGRPLALYRKDLLDPALDDRAVGLARTGAFFSNDQAPLSSRTVRFLSGVHFPPGVARTPNAALYGIENTNRGCDLRVSFLGGQAVPPARSVVHAALPCDAVAGAGGCGTGPVTGKPQPDDGHPPGGGAADDPERIAVDPGGLPVFRGARLVGGIGVALPAGVAGELAEFAALTGAAALAGSLAPVPDPLPAPGVVFIDGVRLPFVRQLRRPAGTAADAPPPGGFVGPAVDGRCVPDGYLAGPAASPALAAAEVDRIVRQAAAGAARTRAVIRLPLGSRARMVFAVAGLDGAILALYRMPDATVFSIDVAVAKARNVVHFSRTGLPGVPAGTAVTNRTISFGAQPLFPPGIDGTGGGPFFGLFQQDLANPCAEGFDPASPNRNGVVFFPGSVPLYRGGALVGGLGVSGDGVEQDDYVAYLGAQGFLPPEGLWADRVSVGGVRLPFLKFPRNPEG